MLSNQTLTSLAQPGYQATTIGEQMIDRDRPNNG
jgi:hypothetical protein